jgi:alpha-D-xyloside xylohydrolase
MRHSFAGYRIGSNGFRRILESSSSKTFAATAILALLALSFTGNAAAQDDANRFVLQRENRTIVLEPYGPNIIRLTLSTTQSAAVASAGYGIVGKPSMIGWSREQDSAGYDVIRSARITVHVAPQNLPEPHPMQLDELNQSLRKHYFYGGDHGRGTYNDAISITTGSDKPLLTMWRWSMVRNASETKPGTQVDGDTGYRISATFDSPQASTRGRRGVE